MRGVWRHLADERSTDSTMELVPKRMFRAAPPGMAGIGGKTPAHLPRTAADDARGPGGVHGRSIGIAGEAGE